MSLPPPFDPATTKAPEDLDIIAARRSTVPGQPDGYAVRWGVRPELAFPKGGFLVTRVDKNGGTMDLPPQLCRLPETTDWDTFRADLLRRSTMAPEEVTEEAFGTLWQLVQMSDENITPRDALVIEIAAFLGWPHYTDEALGGQYGILPELKTAQELTGLPGDKKDLLVSYYRKQAVSFLIGMSCHFDFARLLGLATFDETSETDLVYTVRIDANGTAVAARSRDKDIEKTERPWTVMAPTSLVANRQRSALTHPAFATLEWLPPAPETLTPEETADLGPPFVPGYASILAWDAPAVENRLLGYGAVLYIGERHRHDRATAAEVNEEPFDAAVVERLRNGEVFLRPEKPPHYIDTPAPPVPSHEGQIHYRIYGINLLGVVSPASNAAWVRHYDDLPPAPPRIAVDGERVRTWSQLAGAPVPVDLTISWDAEEDFLGPDCAEFRLSTRWIGQVVVHVRVGVVAPVPVVIGADAGKFQVEVSGLQEPLDRLPQSRLVLPDGEFLIDSVTGPAGLVVFGSSGRGPGGEQDGVIISSATPTSFVESARVTRKPSVPVWIEQITQNQTIELTLAEAGTTLPNAEGTTGSLYVHVMRRSLPLRRIDNVWRVDADTDDTRVAAVGKFLSGTRANWLPDSPGIFFPSHTRRLTLSPPKEFRSGTVEISVVAADGTTYVGSPFGNQSEPVSVTVVLRCIDPPAAPKGNRKRSWARPAATYEEDARAALSWDAAAGAMRYELWRALEPAVGAAEGSGEADLFALLELLDRSDPANLADLSSMFELRTGAIFASRVVDALPGRAPTRAFYLVRAISPEGVAGPWSDFIGPVYVPDVRRPAAPNLVLVKAPVPSGNGIDERCVDTVWTQPGWMENFDYEIECADVSDPFETVQRVTATDARGGAVAAELPADRFSSRLHGITPGRRRRYRVIAIARPLDYADPTWRTRLEIRSSPSNEVMAIGLGDLRPPSGLRATLESGAARLTWTNGDRYDALEVGVRGPDDVRIVWQAKLGGERQLALLTNRLGPGRWQFVVRGSGGSRLATSDAFALEVK